MQIVRAHREHLELLTPLFDAYRVFYQQTSDPERARQFLEARLRAGDSIIYLAHDGDQGLGFTQLYPTFSSVSMERFYILNDLYVRPADRRRGVGEALLARSQELARTESWKGLALETACDNPAQSLYEKMGWEKSTDFYHYFWSRSQP
ncbi:MAG: GNAT family N-acetyltransferase [Bacteroidota bacterium]